jgi:phosphopentomutase
MEKLIAEVKNTDYEGLCFVNLVEFDSEFGHRRNVEGYKSSIEEFDSQLKTLLEELKNDDLLMITADHGNDPTWIGSDHTREQVPLIVYSKKIMNGKYIGEVDSFGSIGASILKNFGLKMPEKLIGNPILEIF